MLQKIIPRFHSVRMQEDKCKGCVNCIRRCPTEAIRVRQGKANITDERCIDCGECIRACPNRAKYALTDELAELKQYKFNIALPAPSLYAQFDLDVSIEQILGALMNIGFDAVFEVARGAELVSLAVRDYLQKKTIRRPVISNACPAVLRLIQVCFPELLDNVLPLNAPVEVAARLARQKFEKELPDIEPHEIGLWFITPCPAKMTTVRQPLGFDKSQVNGVIAMYKVFGLMQENLPKTECEIEKVRDKVGDMGAWGGFGWAVAGGESQATDSPNSLIVAGIHHVKTALEQIAMGKLNKVDHMEALACDGGCVGGPLTLENYLVAEYRIRERTRRQRAQKKQKLNSSTYSVEDVGLDVYRKIEPRSILRMDTDILKAIQKVTRMEKILDELPGLDCGSCGSPGCKALAEDIAQDKAVETDCIFKLREKVRDLASEMYEMAQKLPPSLEKKDDKRGKVE